ncbi:MAG: hypothetical protein BVN34_04270 [Proteobacteria bacterium ST_bin12]|nr:MAG: hypothetical protein BVN34_04270 [Proteobacteria bacterium ST_bin12]
MNRYPLTLILALLSPLVFAEDFDIYSNHKELIDSQILDVGQVVKMKNESYDYSSGAKLKFGSNCYTSYDSNIGGAGWNDGDNKPAFLISSRYGGQQIAILQNRVNSVGLNVFNVSETPCKQEEYSDPKKMIELMQKQNAERMKYYEKLKQDNLELKRKYQK